MFNTYLSSVEALIADIAGVVEELAYIEPDQIAVNFKRSRDSVSEEVLAETTGLSDSNFASIQNREGRIEKFLASKCMLKDGIPVKYSIDLYVPAFFNLNFKEKLLTIFHELYHIHPKFDGELRIFKGKGYKHGSSMERYDKYMEYLVDKYTDRDPPAAEFLKNEHEKISPMLASYKIPRTVKPEPSLFRITWR
jgi:hypothetical protein